MELYINIKKNLPGFNLDVEISSGKEIIGILGASGSGKSMLLNCIAGLVKPDEGMVVINGKTLFDSQKKINLPPRERKVGFLFQNYALFPHLTIRQNIAFGLDGLDAKEKNDKVDGLMKKFRLKDMEMKYPAQISGGQQQRVALARALIVDPEILLLDEPFSALDNHLRTHMIKEMLETLKEFKGTTIQVTHNMEEAYRLCDRIAVLNAGRVEEFEEKRELFHNPITLEVAKITGCKNLSEAIRKSDNEIEIPDWGIQLKTTKKIQIDSGFAGIRANHIKLADNLKIENCFQVWIADENETPFRTTLYLKIGSKPEKATDFHIQWEISQELREEIKKLPQPTMIYIDPSFVIFVEKKEAQRYIID
ncbi:MAG: sulfate/molybdate ABC transporter ATP-binding protein [Eubacteriales bacterium]